MNGRIQTTQEKVYKGNLILKLLEGVEKNPKDINVWLRLAELYRETGKLSKAANAYETLISITGSNNRYKRIIDILKHRPLALKTITPEVREAAFLFIEDFLNPEELQIIENTIIHKHNLFKDSEIVKEHKTVVDESLRSSKSVSPIHFPETEQLIQQKIENQLPTIFSHLEVEAFQHSKIEMQLSRYQDGDFFKLHQDRKIGNTTEDRLITFVYYFYKEPKCFEGGDLYLYDTSPDGGQYRMSFTLFEPKRNSIIFFPSHIYHRVSTVTSSSKSPLEGRFTINGWIHR